jgi:hypothetical protein
VTACTSSSWSKAASASGSDSGPAPTVSRCVLRERNSRQDAKLRSTPMSTRSGSPAHFTTRRGDRDLPPSWTGHEPHLGQVTDRPVDAVVHSPLTPAGQKYGPVLVAV